MSQGIQRHVYKKMTHNQLNKITQAKREHITFDALAELYCIVQQHALRLQDIESRQTITQYIMSHIRAKIGRIKGLRARLKRRVINSDKGIMSHKAENTNAVNKL